MTKRKKMVALMMAVCLGLTGCSGLPALPQIFGEEQPAEETEPTLSEADLAEIAASEQLRAQLIYGKIRDPEKKAEGLEELYKLLKNPEFFSNYQAYYSTMTAEGVNISQNGSRIIVNEDFAFFITKDQTTGDYSAEVAWVWSNLNVVAMRFVECVAAEDMDGLYQCVVPEERFQSGQDVMNALAASGEKEQILKIATDKPDGTTRVSNTSMVATFTLGDGSYYDLSVWYHESAGYRVKVR